MVVFRVLLNRHQIPHHQPFLFLLTFNKRSFKLGVKYFVFYNRTLVLPLIVHYRIEDVDIFLIKKVKLSV